MNQAQPAPRFPNLLQAEAKLVNEILSRFRPLELAMICERRGSASQELVGNMSSGSAWWQRIDQPNDSNSVLEQTFLEIKPFFTDRLRAFFSSLDVGRWTLNVGRSAFQALPVLHPRLLLHAPVSFLHQYVSVSVTIPL
jgi:hypothetical protein